MANPYGAPEISVEEVSKKWSSKASPVLLDVREEMELRLANLGEDIVWVPLSKLARERIDALPQPLQNKEQEIVVFCHTGVRSAQVTAWLRQLGWKNVWSMAGGIDAYARRIDSSIGLY